MKCFFIAASLGLMAITANAQCLQTVNNSDGSKMLTGFITDSLLKTDSAFNWYNKAYKPYQPKANVVKIFASHKDSISLIVFMGTWCEDSHFVIPRFYKILDSAGFNKRHVTMIAVDKSKQDTHHLSGTMHITHVPTIILFKSGKELGRVVEYGETGRYDEELAAIITRSL